MSRLVVALSSILGAAATLAGCGGQDGARPLAPATTAVVSAGSAAPAGPSAAKSPAGPLPSSTVALPQRFCMPTEKLCFNHPAGWSFDVKSPSGNAPTAQMVVLKNAAGKPVYSITSGMDGAGGVCSTGGMKTNYVLAVQPTALTGYAEDETGQLDVASVSTAIITTPRGFQPYVLLTTDKKFSTVGENTDCGLAYATFIRGRSSDHRPVGFAMLGDGDAPLPAYPTKEDAETALRADPDVPVIARILQSAHYA